MRILNKGRLILKEGSCEIKYCKEYTYPDDSKPCMIYCSEFCFGGYESDKENEEKEEEG